MGQLMQQEAQSQQVVVPQFTPRTRYTSTTTEALRAYVTLRLSKGDITIEQGRQIIETGQVPRDDYTLYQSLVERFGGDTSHDTDGTD